MQAGAWFTYPGGMEGWVDLVDLIAPRPGVEPATFRSRVRCGTAAPPRQVFCDDVFHWCNLRVIDDVDGDVDVVCCSCCKMRVALWITLATGSWCCGALLCVSSSCVLSRSARASTRNIATSQSSSLSRLLLHNRLHLIVRRTNGLYQTVE